MRKTRKYLTSDEACKIWEYHRRGELGVDIAARYNVSSTCIGRLINIFSYVRSKNNSPAAKAVYSQSIRFVEFAGEYFNARAFTNDIIKEIKAPKNNTYGVSSKPEIHNNSAFENPSNSNPHDTTSIKLDMMNDEAICFLYGELSKYRMAQELKAARAVKDDSEIFARLDALEKRLSEIYTLWK